MVVIVVIYGTLAIIIGLYVFISILVGWNLSDRGTPAGGETFCERCARERAWWATLSFGQKLGLAVWYAAERVLCLANGCGWG
jgi:hypothetical protein